MGDQLYFTVAVVMGTIVLTFVLFDFVKGTKVHPRGLPFTLTLIGSILVSSPLWSQISIKGENFEIGLYRDYSRQVAQNIELIDNLKEYIERTGNAKTVQNLEEQRAEIASLKERLDRVVTSKNIEDVKQISEKLSSATEKAVEISRPSPPTNLRIIN